MIISLGGAKLILLDNYSKKNTYIRIDSDGYSIIDSSGINSVEDGEGGFTEDGKRNFKVKIRDSVVCDILYKPYVSPFVLTFGDDEDEFDFLLYLSNLIVDKNSILSFIKGMNNLKQHYSNGN